MTNEACDADLDVANRLAEQIHDAPVQGVVGLAIKAYMIGAWDDDLDGNRGDACTLSAFSESSYSTRRVGDTRTDVAHLYLSSHALRGLLASAAAFVPELWPLVARAVESPLTLPLDDTDD